MSELTNQILSAVTSESYRPLRPRKLAKFLKADSEEIYNEFRTALRALIDSGQVSYANGGTVNAPITTKPKPPQTSRDEFIGTYRHNRRGFGFVVPTDSTEQPDDLFIPPGDNNGAMTGDIVRAKITNRGMRDGKPMLNGRVAEIIERTNKRFVGTLAKIAGDWVVNPDGNTLTSAISTPDAATRYIKVGTKVVVEITNYPESPTDRPQGVITEILGKPGEKDVDLRSILAQYNLPENFPDAVKDQASNAVATFNAADEREHRIDLRDEIVCTIDPDDAKDYDDAISLTQLENGDWELGVHIADVSHFVKSGSPLDEEAKARGNSTYFPGHVVPMLPEVLSNGVCSLQEGVPRLCKSAFITYDEDANPIRSRFANTIIHSAQRLRYKEAQAILDGKQTIPHPQGDRAISDYPPAVIEHLQQMNSLAKRLQARRQAQGQLVLNLPQVDLVLDENGKVIDAVPEDESFTHTLIEMFMVEANEAVARLLDSLNVPFLRRIHPDPDLDDASKLRHVAQGSGHSIAKVLDRKGLQQLLKAAHGTPEEFAINLAVLKTLSRAEYSPKVIGHYALASTHYGHFTSPIRRYADLTIHRLLDAYFLASESGKRKKHVVLQNIPSESDLVDLGKHLSFTERRSDEAEKELRQVKLLELLANHIGEEFVGVVSNVTNFGIFVQLNTWLIDGLIRYEDLLDDWWEVDERAGTVRGKRTGQRIGVGDVAKVIIVKVDSARRELNLSVREIQHRTRKGVEIEHPGKKPKEKSNGRPHKKDKTAKRGGGSSRARQRRR